VTTFEDYSSNDDGETGDPNASDDDTSGPDVVIMSTPYPSAARQGGEESPDTLCDLLDLAADDPLRRLLPFTLAQTEEDVGGEATVVAELENHQSHSTEGKRKRKQAKAVKSVKKTKPSKKTTTTAQQDTRQSLSAAYVKRSDSRTEYFQLKLEETKRQFDTTQAQASRQQAWEAKQRSLDREDRRETRKHEAFLMLLDQKKSEEEISRLLRPG
jgi:hypothetical protein